MKPKRSNSYKIIEKHIENEMRDYKAMKRALEEERMAIMDSGYGIDYTRDVVQTSGPSDTTYNMVNRIHSSLSIRRMENNLRAIDEALRQLTDRHRDLFEIMYQQGHGITYAAMEIHLGMTETYKAKNELVALVALKLGYDMRELKHGLR